MVKRYKVMTREGQVSKGLCRQNLTQQALAMRLGVRRQHLSLVANRHRSVAPWLRRGLIDVLNMRWEELFEEVEVTSKRKQDIQE